MRFMIIVKATKDLEAGVLPDEKLLTEMGGVQRRAGEGRRAARGRGASPELEGRTRQVRWKQSERGRRALRRDEELIAGFWLWQVKSKEEAIEWVKRCPNPMKGDSEIEIRQVFEASDFGDALTPELREAEERMREQVAAKK